MKTWVRRTTGVGILSAGFLLIGASVANASPGTGAAENVAAGNGNQISAPVAAPANVTGTGIGVLGTGVGTGVNSGAKAGQPATSEDAGQAGTTSGGGLLSDNQVHAPVQVPVELCGTGIGIRGTGAGTCVNSDSSAQESAREYATRARTESRGPRTQEDLSLLNGNTVSAPVQVPANVCGNGAGVGVGIPLLGQGGQGTGSGSCDGSGATAGGGKESGSYESARRADVDSVVTMVVPVTVAPSVERARESQSAEAELLNLSALNGNTVSAPVQVPANVCGNGVGVGLLTTGQGSGSCKTSGATAGGGQESGGYGAAEAGLLDLSALNGNTVSAPVQVPANVCGNGAGVGVGIPLLGQGQSGSGSGTGSCDGSHATAGGGQESASYESARRVGVDSVVTMLVPVTVAPSVERARESRSVNAESLGLPELSLLNGNTVSAPVQVPANVCGNGVGVLGNGSGSCKNSGPAAG